MEDYCEHKSLCREAEWEMNLYFLSSRKAGKHYINTCGDRFRKNSKL